MRHLLTVVINALLSADADAVCGAEYGVASPERVNSRNGYRHRDLDTRAGTIDVAVPKLRTGTYFPEWLLEALIAVHLGRPFRCMQLPPHASGDSAGAAQRGRPASRCRHLLPSGGCNGRAWPADRR